jgi:AmmeMemoRadiSam system radical SAM enzyme/AmmeMemoRadiSam system protein B/AmmeMemoRadiSam system protein A
MVSTTYGRSTGFCIDPIEKKPLNHFYPGTPVLSFGTAGCNLGCKFCQNWEISKSKQIDSLSELAQPETVAEAARQLGCRSVAFTYNDPVVWAEYAIDCAKACHTVGVKTVAVTAGYITPLARGAFYEVMDAANVDLKGFTEGFYWKLTSGHLEPVRQTLQWLVHETDVWLEVTNLIIPQANDSEDELKAMCQWLVEALGPDVPVHFTAFHPDFRLQDRGRTPPETLALAHDIACRAGLRYAYTGNISDRRRQSTYCPSCGKVLIERDGYQLGVYALDQNRCRHCGTVIAGRFEAGLGNWGGRRMPVRISSYAQAKPPATMVDVAKPFQDRSVATGKNAHPTAAVGRAFLPDGGSRGVETASHQPVQRKGENIVPDQPQPATTAVSVAPAKPQLTKAQEQLVFQAACRRVISAVAGGPPERLEQSLGEIAAVPLLGAFVTLKRSGQLRSCCGFLGQSVPLAQAIDHAAFRAATDDPRFPQISPVELPDLDVDVWLLWGMEPVKARGRQRREAIVIGKHGLQIARGNARGLLLPGVAIEHHLDAEGFLEQVCRKAGLPPTAWQDDDTVLMTFEGFAVEGALKSCLTAAVPQAGPPGPNQTEMAMLADFCRHNLWAHLVGATPRYYLPTAFDGGVHGLVLSIQLAGSDQRIDCGQVSLRPDMPLQSTLFALTKAATGGLQAAGVSPAAVQTASVGVTVLWDPAMLGPSDKADLTGFDPRRRALLVAHQNHWAFSYHPQGSPADLLGEALGLLRLPGGEQAGLFSLAVASTMSRIATSNLQAPQAGGETRPAAVAGTFYPGGADEIDRMLDEWFCGGLQPEPWAAALVPHAGWIYSGRLAAAVFRRVKFPRRVIVLAPKHHPEGANWAVAPHRTWQLPGRSLESDPELARQLAGSISGLELDAAAHSREHAIEVQLPLLARLAPQTRVVGIAIHGGDLDSLERFAQQLAGVLAGLEERPLLVVSSDMNHYADDTVTRLRDRMALDAIAALDPERLYNTVREQRISMCGVLPAVVAMKTLRRLNSLNRCEEVGYATSADASGDRQRVVGYAGALFA